jgi:putative proteasome-type protease
MRPWTALPRFQDDGLRTRGRSGGRLVGSGNLAGTQAVISVLKQRGDATEGAPNLWTARTMFDMAVLVSDAMREIERRDKPHLEKSDLVFNASFILGGQIKGEPMRLFRIYAEGNFIEAGVDTPFLQTGETKYGKPILDRVVTPSTSLTDASRMRAGVVRFDDAQQLSSACPLIVCYQRDTLEVQRRRRFDQGDPYFSALSKEWSEGVRTVFKQLPELKW